MNNHTPSNQKPANAARPRRSASGFGGRAIKMWLSVLSYSMKRGSLVTLVAMSLLAAALGYFSYTSFVTPNVEANEAQLAVAVKQEGENAKNREIERSEVAFKAEFKKAVQLYREAQPLLPSNIEVGNVLAQVQESAKRNGVTLTGLNAVKDGVKSPASDKFYEREMPALVVGTHPQVVRFFNDVASLPRIILIRDFAVTSLRQRVSVSFTLIAYNAPPPTEIPPLPEEFGPLLSVVNQ